MPTIDGFALGSNVFTKYAIGSILVNLEAGIGFITEPLFPSMRQGDTLESRVPNWEDIIEGGNYTPAGSLVDLTYLGDVVNAETVLQAGDSVGYQLVVTNGDLTETYTFGPAAIVGSAPSRITDLALAPGDGQVFTSWTIPSDNGSPLTEYTLDYSVNNAAWVSVTLAPELSSHTITGLTNGDEVRARIFATNAVGSADFSSIQLAIPSGDTTAPTFANMVWDNNTKTLTGDFSEPCQLIFAVHNSGVTIEKDGSGGFTGPILESFTQDIFSSGRQDITVAGTGGSRFTTYIRDFAGNDSEEVFVGNLEFSSLGGVDEPFDQEPNGKLSELSVNWELFNGLGLNVVSGSADSVDDNLNSDRYVGVLPDDQFIEATISGVINHWLYLRASDPDNAIAIHFRSNDSFRIYNRVAGVDGDHIQSSNFGGIKTVGDVYRAEIVGQNLTITKNGLGALVTDVSGTTHTSGGAAIGVSGEFKGYSNVVIGGIS